MKITRERLEQILKEEIAAITEDPRDYAAHGETMKTPPGTIGASRPEDEGEGNPGTEKARSALQKEGGMRGNYNPVGDAMRKLLRRNLTVQEFPADAMANIERSSMLKPMHYNVKGSHGGHFCLQI